MASTLKGRLFKIVTSIHIFLYRRSGGKILNTLNGNPILLLTTTGRKSGTLYTTPVMCIRKDNAYLITATAGGADKNPAWFLNLEKNPAATIEVEGKKLSVTATVTSGEERDRLYELFKASGSNFIEYEKQTTRKIPVVRLQPINA